jgi:hypothetical protein
LDFCPLDGGSDEFVGVFGGFPVRPSSSAMRASSALFCSTRSSIFASEAPGPSGLSALSESIRRGEQPPGGGICSLNR